MLRNSVLALLIMLSASLAHAEDGLSRRYLDIYDITNRVLTPAMVNKKDKTQDEKTLLGTDGYPEIMMSGVAYQITTDKNISVAAYRDCIEKNTRNSSNTACTALKKLTVEQGADTAFINASIDEWNAKGLPLVGMIDNAKYNQQVLPFVIFWRTFKMLNAEDMQGKLTNENDKNAYISYQAFRFASEKGMPLYKKLKSCKQNPSSACQAEQETEAFRKQVQTDFIALTETKNSSKTGK